MVAAANVNVPGSNILIPHSRPHATVQDQDQDRHFTTWLLNWSKRLSKGCWKIGSLAADMSQASYLISFKTWGMFGRCVNDDNWVTRIVQAVAITPGCWWRYAPAVCAVELCWRVVTRDETGNSFLISPSLSCWKLSWKPHHSRGRDQLPAPALVSHNVDISVPCFHNVWRMPLLSTMAIYAKRVFKLNMVSLC